MAGLRRLPMPRAGAGTIRAGQLYRQKAKEEFQMASNEPVGDNRRIGAVKKRSQVKTKMKGEEHWTKRSKETGQFMDQKRARRSLRACVGRKRRETV
jgi:hypothetical protein